ACQGILHHRQVARLENVKRKLATGQKQRPLQRKNRHGFRYVSARSITGIAHLHCNLLLEPTAGVVLTVGFCVTGKRNLPVTSRPHAIRKREETTACAEHRASPDRHCPTPQKTGATACAHRHRSTRGWPS